MSDKIEIYYSCVAVLNPKARDSVNGVSIIYEFHKDNQNPRVSENDKIGFLSTLAEIFSIKD